MNFWSGLKRRLRGEDQTWWSYYRVSFDESHFAVTERRLFGRDRASAKSWADIRFVCFKDGGLGSDVFYVYSSPNGSDTPVMVPVEAEGGQPFWDELRRRALFPAEVSDQAVRSTVTGHQLWWPSTP